MSKIKRGFTLIEIMIAIVILGVISIIGFVVYNTSQNKSTERLLTTKVSLIETSAEKWAEEVNLNRSITITVNRLITDGLIEADNEVGEIINPINKEALNCNTIFIDYQNNSSVAEFRIDETNCDLVEQEQNNANIQITAKTLEDAPQNITNILGQLNWTNKNISLNVKLTGEYAGKIVNGYKWYQNGSLIEGEATETLNIEASLYLNSIITAMVDIQGIGSRGSNIQVRIDKEKPVISNINIENKDDWKNTDKKTTLKANDGNGSGISKYVIKETNIAPTATEWKQTSQISAEVTISNNYKNGTYYVFIKDEADNISEVKSFEINKIDTVKPVVSTNFTTISSISGGIYYKSLTRRLIVEDTESGIASVKYCIAPNNCTPAISYTISNNSKKATVDIALTTNTSAQKICVLVTDLAANAFTVCDTTFKVDGIAPTIGAYSTINSTGTDNYYSNLIRGVTVKDNDSGISSIKYCLTTGVSCTPNVNYTATTGSKSINVSINYGSNTAAQRLCISVTDQGGNTVNNCDTSAFKVDKTSPVINGYTIYSSAQGSAYYRTLTRRVTASDNMSGIATIKYCLTTGVSCTPTTNYNFTYGAKNVNIDIAYGSNSQAQRLCVSITDLAGLTTNGCDSSTYKVDTTPPINVSMVLDSNNNLTVYATDNESGIYSYVCNYDKNTNLSKRSTSYTSANSATCTINKYQLGTTFYANVTVTNRSGLTTTVPVKTFNLPSNIAAIWPNHCYNNEYCEEPFYVKFRNSRNTNYNTFVVYGKQTQGYKAVLNGLYTTTSFSTSACCDTGVCTYDRNNFTTNHIGNILNNNFINTLPTNYQNYMIYASWSTGYQILDNNYQPIESHLDNRGGSAYVGLISRNDWNNNHYKPAFYENTIDKAYWQSNLGFLGSTTYASAAIKLSYQVQNSDAWTIYVLSNLSSFIANMNNRTYTPYARPVIVLNNNIIFTGGSGTKSDPYIIG